jgi:hypothetical protein
MSEIAEPIAESAEEGGSQITFDQLGDFGA